MLDDNYIQQLLDEKDILEPDEFSHTIRLLEQEINRARSNGVDKSDCVPTTSIFKEDIIKLTEKVVVPVDKYPKFNFVGKLLGPKGNTLKRLQGNTKTRISILGRGSTRNKEKEEELSQSDDPKYEHLKEPLHVVIEVEAVKSEAYKRLGTALEQIHKYLEPENDELRQEQMREMAMLAGKSSQPKMERGNAPAPVFTLGLPGGHGGFVLNELPAAVVPKSDTKSFKLGFPRDGSYDSYTDNYPAKKMKLSNGYQSKNVHNAYGDY